MILSSSLGLRFSLRSNSAKIIFYRLTLKRDLFGRIKQISHIETSFPIRNSKRHHKNLALKSDSDDPSLQEKSNIDSPSALPISDNLTSKALFAYFTRRQVNYSEAASSRVTCIQVEVFGSFSKNVQIKICATSLSRITHKHFVSNLFKSGMTFCCSINTVDGASTGRCHLNKPKELQLSQQLFHSIN